MIPDEAGQNHSEPEQATDEIGIFHDEMIDGRQHEKHGHRNHEAAGLPDTQLAIPRSLRIPG
jgi:hypothetical protein